MIHSAPVLVGNGLRAVPVPSSSREHRNAAEGVPYIRLVYKPLFSFSTICHRRVWPLPSSAMTYRTSP